MNQTDIDELMDNLIYGDGYRAPTGIGGEDDLYAALHAGRSDNLEPLDRLPLKPRADWGGMATLLILAVTWGAAAWIMWTCREVGQ